MLNNTESDIIRYVSNKAKVSFEDAAKYIKAESSFYDFNAAKAKEFAAKTGNEIDGLMLMLATPSFDELVDFIRNETGFSNLQVVLLYKAVENYYRELVSQLGTNSSKGEN